MKFDVAWADVLARNWVLKVFFGLTTVIAVVLSIGLVRAATKDPVVVERGCSTMTAELGNPDHTETEIREFVTEAIKSRFDHRVSFVPTFFADVVATEYASEMEQFSRRGIKQTVVVNHIEVQGAEVVVDADRIVSLGKVRVALKFSLKLVIAKVARSSLNPWGLVVEKIEMIGEPDGEETND